MITLITHAYTAKSPILIENSKRPLMISVTAGGAFSSRVTELLPDIVGDNEI